MNNNELKICFTCGNEYINGSPMRCLECIKEGRKIGTSPVSGAYFAYEWEEPNEK